MEINLVEVMHVPEVLMAVLVVVVVINQYLDVVNLDKVLMVSSQADKDLVVAVLAKVAIIVRVVAALDNKRVVMDCQPIYQELKFIMLVVEELVINLEEKVEVEMVRLTPLDCQLQQTLEVVEEDLITSEHKVDQETLSLEMDNRVQDLVVLVLLCLEFQTCIKLHLLLL